MVKESAKGGGGWVRDILRRCLACGEGPSLSLVREKKCPLTDIISRGWFYNPAERISLMEMKTHPTP
jgi:hypothetical protein